jgi:hypothetical protein
MSLSDSLLSQALSVLAGAEYLALNAGVSRLCRSVSLSPPTKGPQTLATWRPRGSLFFTLIKVDGGTVLYCHENERTYHAAPCAWLSEGCPAGTGFLCQWCLDQGEERKEPRLLVFDLLRWECADVAERGRLLRGMAACLPLPLCVVQWVGEPAALDGFLSSLPHDVECILSLGPDPCLLRRQLRVSVPTPQFGPDSFLRAGVQAK